MRFFSILRIILFLGVAFLLNSCNRPKPILGAEIIISIVIIGILTFGLLTYIIMELPQVNSPKKRIIILILLITIHIFGGKAVYKYLVTSGYVDGVGPKFNPEQIIINGLITDKLTKKPLNDRLVILYLNGEEIARDTSKFKESIIGHSLPSDGLFNFITNNRYKVLLSDIKPLSDSVKISQEFAKDNTSQGAFSFNSISEGENASISIPISKAEYKIKVISGEIESLPVEFTNSAKTYLLDDNRVSFKNPKKNVSNNGVYKVTYGISRDSIILNTFKVPLNNCAGSGKISQRYRQSKTYVHEVNASIDASLEASLPIPLGELLSLGLSTKLSGHYGFREGEASEQELEINLIAEPHSNQVYLITWKEMWEKGIALIKQKDGTVQELPFKVKTGLVYEVNSQSARCSN